MIRVASRVLAALLLLVNVASAGSLSTAGSFGTAPGFKSGFQFANVGALYYDFTQMSSLPSSDFNFSRNSTATYFDKNGVMQTVAVNTPRFDYDPSTARTNYIPNSTNQGAAIGTAPTGWVLSTTGNGVNASVVGMGIINGLSYIDVRFQGTATAAGSFGINPLSSNAVAATSGQSWTAALTAAIVGGTLNNFYNAYVTVKERNSSGSGLAETDAPVSLTPTLTRFAASRAFNNASTAFAFTTFQFNYDPGAVVDVTIRVAAFQLERSAAATDFIPTISGPVTVCQPRGLLIEEARTNSLPNGNGTGAAVGSPGTNPTYWSGVGTVNGVTASVVATGTLNGMPYIDYRFQGTATTTGSNNLQPVSTTQIAAAQSQSWTSSLYVALIGGSLSNVSPAFYIKERDSSGANLADSNAVLSLTSSLTRYSISRTFSSASTAYAFSVLTLNYNSGAVIDFTLRVTSWQLEQGSFPTSYIPTTSAAVTRGGDVTSFVGLPAFYLKGGKSTGVSGVFEVGVEGVSGAPRIVGNLNNPSDFAEIQALNNASAYNGGLSSNISSSINPALTANGGSFGRVGFSMNSTGRSVTGGQAVSSDAFAWDPSSVTPSLGTAGSNYLNGWFRRGALWSGRLSDSVLLGKATAGASLP